MINATSRKKRDTMLCYSNTTAKAPNGGSTYLATDAVLTGGNAYIFPWVATARPALHKTAALPGSILEQSIRTATTCYMRGLKETINMQFSSSAAWQWRRICFTQKGDFLLRQANSVAMFYDQETTGVQRVVNNANGQQLGNSIVGLIFKGTQGVDWNNWCNAPTDTSQINVYYDKTRILQSPNSNGTTKTVKMWHPMNKNLVYGDKEIGDSGAYTPFSQDGRAGMGDYYVIDIIQTQVGSTATDTLTWGPNATLYWHEK